MKLIILVAVALVAAVVADVPEPVKIVRSELNQNPDGSYTFTFESEDGTVRQETGELKEVLDENNKLQKVIVVRGSYTYINPDGKPESINYSADEGGFSAEGESIPKKPEQVSRK